MAQIKKVNGRPPIEIDPNLLKETYLKYGSIREAAKALGLSKDTFHKKLKENGVARKKLLWVMPE